MQRVRRHLHRKRTALPLWTWLVVPALIVAAWQPRLSLAQEQPADTTEVIEFALDAAAVGAGPLFDHNSPVPESGTGWVRINGELLQNKRITITLYKGNPVRRAAISGRADAEGVWRWRQRPRNLGYAPFDIERGDKIHLICRNGDEIKRCYRIEEVRTNEEGFVVYFRGRQVPC